MLPAPIFYDGKPTRKSLASLWQAGRDLLRTGLRLLPGGAVLEDWRCFFQAWRRDPRAVGALAPSGRALARAITTGVPTEGQVLELGAGTGSFTKALLEAGHCEDRLILVERDAQLAQLLRKAFPLALVVQGDAGLSFSGSIWPGVVASPASIVCGLPMLNMTLRQQMRVMRGAWSVLPNDGAVLLFTYGLRCPLKPELRSRLGLRVRRVTLVLGNLPPAVVWRVTKRSGMSFRLADPGAPNTARPLRT